VYETVFFAPRRGRSSSWPGRMFGEDIFDHFALIAACQGAGFSLIEIRTLKNQLQESVSPGPHLRALASNKHQELDRATARLRDMKSVLGLLKHCSCPTLADCGGAARRMGALKEVELGCSSPPFGR